MLGRYIKIENVRIPNPVSFSENYPPLENVFTSEAGTQMSSVVRLNRYTWSGEFNVSSRGKAQLIAFAQEALVTCLVNGVSHRGRLRISGDISLVEGSEYVGCTDGLWRVPLIFEEF